MNSHNKKTLDVSRGFTYTYYAYPAKDRLPTLLLFHGWPDSAALWSGLVKDYLVPNGYGAIAIDCLGYAGTSKPVDAHAYDFKGMSADAVEIIDAEKLDKVVSVGHDWGCGIAQRFYNWHPDRVSGLVMLNVAYLAPTGDPFDLDKVLEMTQQIFGYGTYWYWKLFGSDDGYKLLNEHIESLWTIAHGAPETWRDETLCKPDGVKNYLLADKKQPTEPYATEELKQEFIQRMQQDGFQAPQGWYRAMMNQVQSQSDKGIPKENAVVNVPTLYWAGAKDMVCRPEAIYPSQQAGLLPHLKVETVDAGHWAMLAKPKEFGEAMVGWLKDVL